MNYDLINLIIQAFIAVGTVGAVCVSLYYSHKLSGIYAESAYRCYFVSVAA